MTRYQLLGMFVTLGAVSLNVSSARAQSCEATTDCPKNYLCSVVARTGASCESGSAGAASAGAPANPVPVDGGVTTAGAPGAGGSSGAYRVPITGGSVTQTQPDASGGSVTAQECTPTTYQVKQCVALACTSDSACSTGWSCQTTTTTTCSTMATVGGAASMEPPTGSGNMPSSGFAAGGSAADIAPTTGATTSVEMPADGSSPSNCVTNTQSTCKPKAQNPCEVDEDCGPGYDCVDDTSCACSGSGGTAVDGSGGEASVGSAGSGAMVSDAAPIDSPAPECVCGPSGTASCQARTIECQSRTDCPETWTCITGGDSTDVAAGGGTSTSTSAGAATSTNPAPDMPTSSNCLPPYDYYSGKGLDIGNGGAQTAVDGSASTPVVSTGGSASTGSNAPGADPANESNSAADTTASTTGARHSGGCQISHSNSTQFMGAMLGLLAMFGLRRRRVAR